MKKEKILLVDDEELTRLEFAQIFEDTKYKLDLAVNSVEGLEKIKNNDYDLILLDLIMPDLSNRQNKRAGFELLTKIKELKPKLPIIMVSAETHARIAFQSLDLGASGYITKDKMTGPELINKVEGILKSARILPQAPDLSSLIQNGEGLKLEFKSSMRWNYNANKIDSEIEFECLRAIAAFLNTEGGTLLIGVRDDGEILGIEADRFPTEDGFLLRFNNLITQYIGAEFSSLIRFELIPANEKKVLKVECETSKEPVFFKKTKDEEEFYIRVGNSTRKLSPAKMLNYLNARKV